MEAFQISQYRLAKKINVPPRRVSEIIHGKRGISADTALRLGCFFGTTPEFWMNLQSHFTLESERERLASDLSQIHSVQTISTLTMH
ncbi:MAG: HigA family addiction module antidote protein [Magnetococcales bacterium]|nr:HigA family addiction module antidote protein [Magnetococcales bacterium]